MWDLALTCDLQDPTESDPYLYFQPYFLPQSPLLFIMFRPHWLPFSPKHLVCSCFGTFALAIPTARMPSLSGFHNQNVPFSERTPLTPNLTCPQSPTYQIFFFFRIPTPICMFSCLFFHCQSPPQGDKPQMNRKLYLFWSLPSSQHFKQCLAHPHDFDK